MRLIQRIIMGRVWVVTILLAVATIAGATAFVANGSRQTDIPPVGNKTQALQVTGVQIQGPMLSIQLKNVSGKTVTGYVLSLGPGSGMDVDFPYTEYKNPGDSFACMAPMYKDGKIVDVVIDSVVFQNRSFEGNDEAAARMINRRLGKREQFIRALRLIENALRKLDGELSAATQVLEQNILSLASLAVPSQLGDFWRKKEIESGMSSAKENIRGKIQALKKGNAYGASLRNDLSSIAEEYRNIISAW